VYATAGSPDRVSRIIATGIRPTKSWSEPRTPNRTGWSYASLTSAFGSASSANGRSYDSCHSLARSTGSGRIETTAAFSASNSSYRSPIAWTCFRQFPQ
jgi:hypothetical protein